MGAMMHSSNGNDSSSALDDRAERLLRSCSDLEAYENRITPDEYAGFIESAVFACGFHSLEEACESLIGPELFSTWQRVDACFGS